MSKIEVSDGPFYYREIKAVQTHRDGFEELLVPDIRDPNKPFCPEEVIELFNNAKLKDTKYVHIFERRIASLSDLPKVLTTLHPRDWSLKSLDHFTSEHTDAAFQLHLTLLNLPPKLVYEKFGINAVIWTACHSPDTQFYVDHPVSVRTSFHGHIQDFDYRAWLKNIKNCSKNYCTFLKELLKDSNPRSDEIDRMISACNRWLDPSHPLRSFTVLKNLFIADQLYALGDQLTDCSKLQDLLRCSFYSDRRFSEEAINDYSLKYYQPMGTRDFGDATRAHDRLEEIISPDQRDPVEVTLRGPFLDSPFGLVLCWKGEPQAVVSFLATDPRTITIVQLQGIVGRRWKAHRDKSGKLVKNQVFDEDGRPVQRGSRGLIGLNWDLLLIRCAENIAHSLGIPSTQILPGKDNPWTGSEKGRKKFYAPEASRYNKVADTMGYEYEESLGIFRVDLKRDKKIPTDNPRTPRGKMLKAEASTPTQS